MRAREGRSGAPWAKSASQHQWFPSRIHGLLKPLAYSSATDSHFDTARSNGIEKSIPNRNVDGETVVSFQIIAQPVVA